MVDTGPPSISAVVLVGGLGTRFRSVRDDIPKPLAHMAGRPVLEHLIVRLKQYGVEHVVFCVGHLGEMIETHFADGNKFGMKIEYAHEHELLGTGGAIANAAPHISGDTFLAMNGDTLLPDLDFADLLREHQRMLGEESPIAGTLVVTPPPDPGEYGVIALDESGVQVIGFREKAPIVDTASALISAGVYVLDRKVIDLVPRGQKVSIEFEVFPGSLERGDKLFAYRYDGYFGDMGTPAGYARLGAYLKQTMSPERSNS